MIELNNEKKPIYLCKLLYSKNLKIGTNWFNPGHCHSIPKTGMVGMFAAMMMWKLSRFQIAHPCFNDWNYVIKYTKYSHETFCDLKVSVIGSKNWFWDWFYEVIPKCKNNVLWKNIKSFLRADFFCFSGFASSLLIYKKVFFRKYIGIF